MFFEGNFSLEKTVTKGVIEIASRRIGSSSVFGPTEQIVNDNLFNGVDKLGDEIRDKK